MTRNGLSEVECRILEFLLPDDGEGLTLAHDIAVEVGVSPRSIGARLRALCERGLIWGHYYPDLRLNGWAITEAGAQAIAARLP